MSAIDYEQKIPNNVDLKSDKKLQRALEQWPFLELPQSRDRTAELAVTIATNSVGGTTRRLYPGIYKETDR